MLGSIKYNLTHLLDFRGRDARQTFWYYVLFLAILYVIGWVIALAPLIGSAVQGAMKAAQAGVPQDQIGARMMQGMGPGMTSIAWFGLIANLAFTLLILAAFVRRLHDSGNPGWWAGAVLAIRLATVGFGIAAIGKIDAAVQQVTAAMGDPGKLQQIQAQSMHQSAGQTLLGLAGWIAFIVVLVFGVFGSTDGPNRYGEAPVVF